MDTGKYQKEVLNRLLKNDLVRVDIVGENSFVSTDGFSAVRIPLKNVCFNLDRCANLKNLHEFFELSQEDYPLKFSKIMKQTPNGVLMKLVPENSSFVVWVSKKLLDVCGESNLFGSSPIQPVKCQNQISGQIDVVVMPTRTSEES